VTGPILPWNVAITTQADIPGNRLTFDSPADLQARETKRHVRMLAGVAESPPGARRLLN
jgi:hypothetical protein